MANCKICSKKTKTLKFSSVQVSVSFCTKCIHCEVIPVQDTSLVRKTYALDAVKETEKIISDLSAHPIKFNILVWGPSPNNDCPVARKRVALRDHLTKKHAPFFSEETYIECDVPADLQEAQDIERAELVIALVYGPGATGEGYHRCF